jgi:FkbM family methyltransferase
MQLLRRWARRLGYDLHRYSWWRDDRERRTRLMAAQRIDLVLDVGANTGQFRDDLRAAGYTGEIVSFEPLAAACAELRRRTPADSRWELRQLALGDRAGEATIHQASCTATSSLLLPGEYLASRLAEARTVAVETVRVETLANVFAPEWARRRIYLKIDTQGFEMAVLRGAEAVLPRIHLLQVELSLRPLYEGETGGFEIMTHLQRRGFRLAGFEPGFSDPTTGEMLQVDGLFLPATEAA